MDVLTIDLGASSGRVLWAHVDKDEAVTLKEIHRFDNVPVRVGGRLMWDHAQLFADIKTGVKKAAETCDFDSIGIDTWGVDFAIVSKSGVASPPAHYRDETHKTAMNGVFGLIGERELFEETGVISMDINTLFQLRALKTLNPAAFAPDCTMLLMPDFFKWLLTGDIGAEVSIASTTQLFDLKARDWHWRLIERLDLPATLFPPVKNDCAFLSPELCRELNIAPKRVFSAGHDTACAAVAANVGGNGVFISSGTWSIVGANVAAPVVSDFAMNAGFASALTNGGQTLLLRNITGLWVVQQLRREYGGGVTFAEMELLARESAGEFIIDPDDAVFSPEGPMSARIEDFCVKAGQGKPQTRGDVIRAVYRGLAAKYATTVRDMETLTNGTFDKINIIGGGAQSALLREMTEETAKKRVSAGLVEATAVGNAIIQYRRSNI